MVVDVVPDRARKGRGAVSNRVARFESHTRVRTDDGWSHGTLTAAGGEGEDDAPPLATRVLDDHTKSIIARNDSPDVPFDRSVNPYRGCEHGCIYCFARPSHAFLGLSPGLDFEAVLVRKPDAPALLDRELRAKGYTPSVLCLGSNTDPYQPLERTERLTRRILEVLRDFNHPVGIVTKSALVTRDLDILGPMAAKGLASVAISVTTLDRDLARTMEPRAATPARRLAAIREVAAAGVPVAVLASPMIPALNDHELEAILEAGAEAGATRAGTVMLRLPLELADLFTEWLHEHVPDRAARILSLIRQSRNGALYTSDWGTRMTGAGPLAALLRQRFDVACRRLGLNRRRWDLDCSQFKPPSRPGDQPSLF